VVDPYCDNGPSLICATAVAATVMGWLPTALGAIAVVVATTFYMIGIWESQTMRQWRERWRKS